MSAIEGIEQLLEARHENTIWTRYAAMFLGIWLIVSTFSFQSEVTSTSISDIVCGFLLIFFGKFSLREKNHWAPWCICLIGIWLQLAPLVFWTKLGAIYLNDTVSGCIAIALSILIPGTPGMIESGPQIPEGWSYNPSSFAQRLPIALLTFLAWITARYMASYQLGYIDSIVDPVFGKGTFKVITSYISKDFPVSDAGLGAFAYTIETLMCVKGGSRRWHAMPWIVALFGFLVIPVGLVSIVLIMLQPIYVGFWCFWCLLTAVFMLLMIALTVDESIASLQLMIQAHRENKPFWHTFFKGASPTGGLVDTHTPMRTIDLKMRDMFRGVEFQWNLVLSAVLGIWIMFCVPLFRQDSSVQLIEHIQGALVVAISVISCAEVLRIARFCNVLFGLVLVSSTLLFPHHDGWGFVNNLIVSLLLIVLSIPKGRIKNRYGSFDRFIA